MNSSYVSGLQIRLGKPTKPFLAFQNHIKEISVQLRGHHQQTKDHSYSRNNSPPIPKFPNFSDSSRVLENNFCRHIISQPSLNSLEAGHKSNSKQGNTISTQAFYPKPKAQKQTLYSITLNLCGASEERPRLPATREHFTISTCLIRYFSEEAEDDLL